MEIVTTHSPPFEIESKALVLFHYEDVTIEKGPLDKIDQRLNGALSNLVLSGELSGKLGEVVVVHTIGQLACERLVIVGVGNSQLATCQQFRLATGHATKVLRKKHITSITVCVQTSIQTALSLKDFVQSIVEGATLANYDFATYRTMDTDSTAIEKMLIAAPDTGDSEKVLPLAITKGQAVGEATNTARDLCNHPGNVMTPTYFSECAEAIASDTGMTINVFERPEIESLGMGALLGVAQGSHEPPAFVVLEYTPSDEIALKQSPVVLIGKTVTFDSGGVSLKNKIHMEHMKADMGGGAAVLGAMKTIAGLQIPLRVVALFPVVENVMGSRAIKPGDVVNSMSGKTIEVLDTDAEGRLILADALHYAQRFEPDCIIDIATLTGASSIVFGPMGIGMFGTDHALKCEMEVAGTESGERVWELPLWPEYKDLLRSYVADLRNISTIFQEGSMMTAASFLHHFVDETPWVHLDIYNTCWNDEEHPLHSKGPTGSGTRTLVKFLINRAFRKEAADAQH